MSCVEGPQRSDAGEARTRAPSVLSQALPLSHCTPVFTDNLCKQFGPRSGPTFCRALSGSKLFDNLKVFLKEFFKKDIFEKNQGTPIKHAKLHAGKCFPHFFFFFFFLKIIRASNSLDPDQVRNSVCNQVISR